MLELTGDVGEEFYFVLQGSVAIKIDKEVIKVYIPVKSVCGPSEFSVDYSKPKP